MYVDPYLMQSLPSHRHHHDQMVRLHMLRLIATLASITHTLASAAQPLEFRHVVDNFIAFSTVCHVGYPGVVELYGEVLSWVGRKSFTKYGDLWLWIGLGPPETWAMSRWCDKRVVDWGIQLSTYRRGSGHYPRLSYLSICPRHHKVFLF